MLKTSEMQMFDMILETEDETDTFDNGGGRNSVALSGQLADLRMRYGGAKRSPKESAVSPGKDRAFTLELPNPARLQHLLGIYFIEMDSYFPFIERRETEKRIHDALQGLGYSESNTIVEVDKTSHPIMALLCNLLVLGECHEPLAGPLGNSRPGLILFNRGRKLLQRCTSARTVDMDLIRYHTLSALYMLDSEMLQSASHAISAAVQSAMVMRLNDQSVWRNCPAAEKPARQRLWWTIYYLDRRISQRNGTPYLVRDLDISVDEFTVKTGSSSKDSIHDIDQPSRSVGNHYQSLIDFGRLWGFIWDSFYSVSAPKSVQWKDIA